MPEEHPAQSEEDLKESDKVSVVRKVRKKLLSVLILSTRMISQSTMFTKTCLKIWMKLNRKLRNEAFINRSIFKNNFTLTDDFLRIR